MKTCNASVRWFLSIICALTSAFVAAQETKLQVAKPAVRFERDVDIPMRDGVRLRANLFRPTDVSECPVLLMRTPYGKPGDDWGEALQWCAAGYAVIAQDCRGRGASEGTWEPFRDDRADGLDTLRWLKEQPWCNGRIGMIGGSYVGWTQWAAAAEGSEYLQAIAPVVPFTHVYDDIAYPGGAFQLALAFGWGVAVGGNPIDPAQLPEQFKALPLNRWNEQFPLRLDYLRAWIEHPRRDAYWAARGIDGRYSDVRVPVLNIGGWYDIFSTQTMQSVAQVREQSGDRLVRRNQFVIMGPWAHAPSQRQVGARDFGSEAVLDLNGLQRDWFDYWLQDRPTRIEQWPAIKLFVMGENRWRDEHEWPLARTKYTSWYLHSDGAAATAQGNGRLSENEPESEPSDTYTYDPANPVPTMGGNNLVGAPIGPFDQREIEQRSDVLVYTSPPLTAPLEVTGPVKLILYVSSSAVDTDFTAKLVEVAEDGTAWNLCDGITRLRFRQSNTELQLAKPGEVYELEVELGVTSHLFPPGSRLRLEVSSSNFPRFDRNLNTADEPGTGDRWVSAEQTVFHDVGHPSRLILPVIPR